MAEVGSIADMDINGPRNIFGSPKRKTEGKKKMEERNERKKKTKERESKKEKKVKKRRGNTRENVNIKDKRSETAHCNSIIEEVINRYCKEEKWHFHERSAKSEVTSLFGL